MASSQLNCQKERMKTQKALREIQKLKNSQLPLNPDQRTKANKEEELRQYLEQLDTIEGVSAPSICIMASIKDFSRHDSCIDAPLVEHQQFEGKASQNRGCEPQEVPKMQQTGHKGQTDSKQELQQQSCQSDLHSSPTLGCKMPLCIGKRVDIGTGDLHLISTPHKTAKRAKARVPEEVAIGATVGCGNPSLTGKPCEECPGGTGTAVSQIHSDMQTYEVKLVGIDSAFVDRQQEPDVAKKRIAALEQEVGTSKRLHKTCEDERKKAFRDKGLMATEINKCKKELKRLEHTVEFHNGAMEAQRIKFAKELEDMSMRHTKEKEDLRRSIEQLKRTVETKQSHVTQVQRQLEKEEEHSRTLTTLLGTDTKSKSLQSKSLQEISTGLEEKVERQKLKVKQMSAKIGRRQKMESDLKVQLKDLSEMQSDMREGFNKLKTQSKNLHEERKRVAARVAADLFSAGHQLEAFLRTIEPELLCPITYELPEDPALADDGWTYEREAITRWQNEKQHANSPMTGAPLDHDTLTPNFTVKKLVALVREWQARCSKEKA